MTDQPISAPSTPLHPLDWSAFVEYMDPKFPRAFNMQVVKNADGVPQPPIAVTWIATIPLQVLESMGINVTITDDDGTVVTPERYAEMLLMAVEDRERGEQNGASASDQPV